MYIAFLIFPHANAQKCEVYILDSMIIFFCPHKHLTCILRKNESHKFHISTVDKLNNAHVGEMHQE